MAKQPQDEMGDKMGDQNKTRDSQFGVRDFGRESQAAGREAHSAARHAQQAMAEITRTTIPPLPSPIQPRVVSSWLTDLPKKISSSEFQPMIDTY